MIPREIIAGPMFFGSIFLTMSKLPYIGSVVLTMALILYFALGKHANSKAR